MSRKKRADRNSVKGAVEGFAGAMAKVAPPAGIKFDTEEGQLIWSQFTRARAPEDWRDVDLLMLAKIVRMELDLRMYRETLDDQGHVIENKRGTMVTNPLISIIDTLERRQLAVIRSMSLNQVDGDPRTVHAKGKQVAQTADQASSVKNEDEDNLIPTPQIAAE